MIRVLLLHGLHFGPLHLCVMASQLHAQELLLCSTSFCWITSAISSIRTS